ncbi:MAG TPA: zinc ribbon domain-containing protein [Thermoplasmata archaeon]|nr:zinc ribbon domain-containing protein [Thermoplasmata archaeon]
MSLLVSILAAGSALPRYRLGAAEVRKAFGGGALRGVDSVTVAGHDEDELTLAVEAAAAALGSVEELPSHLIFSSSGETPGAATVTKALGLDCVTADKLHTAESFAPLAAALDSVTANHAPVLVVWSDAPGGSGFGKAAEIDGAGAVALLLSGSGFADIRLEAKSKDKAPDPGVWKRIGNLRCAGPAFAMLELLSGAKEGSKVLVGEPGGRMALLTVTSTPDVASPLRAASTGGVQVDLHHAARLRAALVPEDDSPMGAFVSDQLYDASIGSRYRLEAQKCDKCGHVQLPPRTGCLRCGADGGTKAMLERAGEVEAVTVVARGAAPGEFLHQQAMAGEYAVAIISLKEEEGDGRARVVAQLTDCDANSVKIGDRVEAVFRRLYFQLGKARYGLKFRPAG